MFSYMFAVVVNKRVGNSSNKMVMMMMMKWLVVSSHDVVSDGLLDSGF